MESIWLEYAWALLILIGLEGLLSADNALVLAVIAKHLPEEQKKRAINYGIIMAFVFRFAALFAISFIADVWQIQAIGAELSSLPWIKTCHSGKVRERK